MAFRIAGDDERIVEHAAHDVVAVLRNLRFVAHEHPRSAEQALLFAREQLVVVVDVRGNHPPPHVLDKLGCRTHAFILLYRIIF